MSTLSTSKEKNLIRLEKLSALLDSSIPLGNSGYKVGVDPILGLIPGVGDSLSALISVYIIVEAARLGASTWTLVRMMMNLGADTLIGSIPIFGDLFDFAFKANQRNVDLLKRTQLHENDDSPRRLSLAFVLLVLPLLIILLAIIIGMIYGGYRLLLMALHE